MADLSAAPDPGSGHLLGCVLGNGQAVSMAAHHVCTPSVYVDVLAFHLVFHLVSEAFYFPLAVHICSHRPLPGSETADRQGTSQPLWHHIGHSINNTNDSITLSNSTDNGTALMPLLSDLPCISTYN